MSEEQQDIGGTVEDRRAKARAQEEALVATAIVEMEKLCKIICSRQGDVLEQVLTNLKRHHYDVDKLAEETSKLIRKVAKRVRRYKE